MKNKTNLEKKLLMQTVDALNNTHEGIYICKRGDGIDNDKYEAIALIAIVDKEKAIGYYHPQSTILSVPASKTWTGYPKFYPKCENWGAKDEEWAVNDMAEKCKEYQSNFQLRIKEGSPEKKVCYSGWHKFTVLGPVPRYIIQKVKKKFKK